MKIKFTWILSLIAITFLVSCNSSSASKNDELGKPYFTKHPFDGQVHLSISHSNLEAVAFVVLEKN